MSAPAKIERKGYLAIQMLQDSILLALLATVTTAVLAHVAFLPSLLAFGGASLGIFLGTLVIQAIFNAARESLPRKLAGWAVVSLVLAAVYDTWIGDDAWYLAAAAFLLTAVHTLVLHPRADREFRSEEAEKAGNLALARRLADEGKAQRPLPTAAMAHVQALPADLPPELRALFDDALAAYLELHDLGQEPAFVALSGAFGREAEVAALELLAELARRLPLLARVRRLAQAGEAPKASQDAEDDLRQRIGAAQAAAQAALALAASERPAELARLQDAVDALHALADRAAAPAP